MFTFQMRFPNGSSIIMGRFEDIYNVPGDARYDMIDLINEATKTNNKWSSASFCVIGSLTEDSIEYDFPGWPEKPPQSIHSDDKCGFKI